jgi:hypothetical protein
VALLSRQIDPDNLTEEDRKYLQDRSIDPDAFVEQHRLRTGEPRPEDEPAKKNQAGGPEADEPSDDAEDVPYSEWTIAELRTEIEGREGLEVPEGKPRKGELIALLERDDAEDGVTGSTDDPDEDETLVASDPQPANPADVDRGVLNRS